MEVVLGHVVHHYMLLRPALAALDHMYRFVSKHRGGAGFFGPPLIEEIRTVRGLIFLAGVDMAARWSPLAYC